MAVLGSLHTFPGKLAEPRAVHVACLTVQNQLDDILEFCSPTLGCQGCQLCGVSERTEEVQTGKFSVNGVSVLIEILVASVISVTGAISQTIVVASGVVKD